AKLEGRDKMLHLLESLCYEQDAAALAQATELANAFVASVQSVPADKLETKKGEVMQVASALQYLAKFKLLPEGFAATGALADIIKAQGWDKKK
ncbi:MAG: DUF1080 domain-containing protein, partial [Roseimicrobium sp.]